MALDHLRRESTGAENPAFLQRFGVVGLQWEGWSCFSWMLPRFGIRWRTTISLCRLKVRGLTRTFLYGFQHSNTVNKYLWSISNLVNIKLSRPKLVSTTRLGGPADGITPNCIGHYSGASNIRKAPERCT